MIALNPAMWILSGHYGEQVSFDTEQIHTELFEAFFMSGAHFETWLADDIIAGIEYAVAQLPQEARQNLTLNDLAQMVAQMLRQSGHDEVADTYLHLRYKDDEENEGLAPYVYATLVEYFEDWESNKLANLADKIVQLLTDTNMLTPSKILIYELAVHFNEKPIKTPIWQLPKPVAGPEKPKILLTQSAIINLQSASLKTIFNAKIIEVHPISTLFPSLNIRLDWLKIIEKYIPNGEVNEFTLYPHLHTLSAEICTLYAKVQNTLQLPELPLSIEINQTESFIIEKLHALNDTRGKRLANDFFEEILTNVTPTPYKKLMF